MKYLKRFESILEKSVYKPGYMYKYDGYNGCFIGLDEDDKSYPNIFLLFDITNKQGIEIINSFDFNFINWNHYIENDPMIENGKNVSIEEYIIKNNILKEIINAMENPEFVSGGSLHGKKLIKELLNKIKSNDDIRFHLNMNKFNL